MHPRHKTVLLTIATTSALLVLPACGLDPGEGGGPYIERRGVADVTAVSFTAPGDLVITDGPPALTVTAQDNLIGRVTSEVHDGVLFLDLVGPVVGDIENVRFELSLPAVDEVSVEGSGRVDLGGARTDELTLAVEGSCALRGRDLDVNTLTVSAGGSAVVDLAGVATRQTVTLDEAGQYQATALATQDAEVKIRDEGSARVQVSDQLRATVEGAGTIVHTGGAAVIGLVSAAGRVSAW